MKNYYQILGVDRNASADEIKRAYRKLAGQHHPDKGGDTHQFQEIQKAYETIGDPQKRAEYDNPGMSMHGGVGGSPFDFESIFNVFGTRFTHPGQQRRQQARMTLWIMLVDSARGGRKTISVGSQQGVNTIEVEIPLGINDQDTVQYPGIGPGGMDLIITYRIHPTPQWERHDTTLITDQTISIWNLILGCEISLTDILGSTLSLTIPAGTQPGTMLRLRGKGMPQRHGQPGDLLVRIQVSIPKNIDPVLLEAIRNNCSQ
jgi:DnaJ-class molecular chaperone